MPKELSSDWENVTPEKMLQNSNRQEFRHKKTGLKIAFDKGVAGKPKFREKDHWHIYNPFSASVRDYYLSKDGTKIHKNNDDSHIQIYCK